MLDQSLCFVVDKETRSVSLMPTTHLPFLRSHISAHRPLPTLSSFAGPGFQSLFRVPTVICLALRCRQSGVRGKPNSGWIEQRSKICASLSSNIKINKRPVGLSGLGDPDVHLGAKLRKATLGNGFEAWSMSPSKCAQEAAKNVRNLLRRRNLEAHGPRRHQRPL
jgi:hypothetical protein